MSDTLIKVDGVSKKFCRSLKKSLWYGLEDLGNELRGRRHGGNSELRPGEFWAVKDVSFELKRGECLGLIGRNGAGKTTLLRMLNGLVKPDQGRIEMHGRVAAMIALGAGFNPILTGRENIYINASVLGLKKMDIDRKLDEIIDFADIGDFIDSPVQSYSSGMQVRLGFAVATALDPDVLLIDEVLAVGDVRFRAKCYSRIDQFKTNSAIILVSHNMHDIGRASNMSLVMDAGKLAMRGNVVEAMKTYQNLNATRDGFLHVETGFSAVRAEVIPRSFAWGGSAKAYIEFDSAYDVPDALFRVVFMDQSETFSAEWRSTYNDGPTRIHKGRNVLEVQLDELRLQTGTYFINIIVSATGRGQYLIFSFKRQEIDITGPVWGFSTYQLAGSVRHSNTS